MCLGCVSTSYLLSTDRSVCLVGRPSNLQPSALCDVTITLRRTGGRNRGGGCLRCSAVHHSAVRSASASLLVVDASGGYDHRHKTVSDPSEHRLRAVICGTATSESLRRETSSGRRFDLSLPLCRPSPPSRPRSPGKLKGVLGGKGSRSHESIVTGLPGPHLCKAKTQIRVAAPTV